MTHKGSSNAMKLALSKCRKNEGGKRVEGTEGKLRHCRTLRSFLPLVLEEI